MLNMQNICKKKKEKKNAKCLSVFSCVGTMPPHTFLEVYNRVSDVQGQLSKGVFLFPCCETIYKSKGYILNDF